MTGRFFATAVMVLAGTLFLAAYGYSKYGRSAMAEEYKGMVIQAEKPRIDKAIPARIETATLALS